MCRSINESGGNPNRRCPIHRPDTVIAIHTVSQEVDIDKDVIEAVFIELRKEGRALGVSRLEIDNYADIMSDLNQRFEATSPGLRYRNVANEFTRLTAPKADTLYALRRLKGAAQSRKESIRLAISNVAEETNQSVATVEMSYRTIRSQILAGELPEHDHLWSRQSIRQAEDNDLPSDKASVIALAILPTIAAVRGEAVVEREDLSGRGNGIIQSGGYDEETGRLELVFMTNPDRVYSYQNVPLEMWNQIAVDSPSPMRYFNQNIRGNPLYQYDTEENDTQSSATVQCGQCGQFTSPSLGHVCPPTEEPETAPASAVEAGTSPYVVPVGSHRRETLERAMQRDESLIALEEDVEPAPAVTLTEGEPIAQEPTVEPESVGEESVVIAPEPGARGLTFTMHEHSFAGTQPREALQQAFSGISVETQQAFADRAAELHAGTILEMETLATKMETVISNKERIMGEVPTVGEDEEVWAALSSSHTMRDTGISLNTNLVNRTEDIQAWHKNFPVKVSDMHSFIDYWNGHFSNDISLSSYQQNIIDDPENSDKMLAVVLSGARVPAGASLQPGEERFVYLKILGSYSLNISNNSDSNFVASVNSNYWVRPSERLGDRINGINYNEIGRRTGVTVSRKNALTLGELPIATSEESIAHKAGLVVTHDRYKEQALELTTSAKTLVPNRDKVKIFMSPSYYDQTAHTFLGTRRSNYHFLGSGKFRTASKVEIKRALREGDSVIVPVELVVNQPRGAGGYSEKGMISGDGDIVLVGGRYGKATGYVKLIKDDQGNPMIDPTFNKAPLCTCTQYAKYYKCTHITRLETNITAELADINNARVPSSARRTRAEGALPLLISERNDVSVSYPDDSAPIVQWSQPGVTRESLESAERGRSFHPPQTTSRLNGLSFARDFIVTAPENEGLSEAEKILADKVLKSNTFFSLPATPFKSSLKNKAINTINFDSNRWSRESTVSGINPYHRHDPQAIGTAQGFLRGTVDISLDGEQNVIVQSEQLRCTCGRFVAKNGNCEHVVAARAWAYAQAHAALGSEVPDLSDSDTRMERIISETELLEIGVDRILGEQIANGEITTEQANSQEHREAAQFNILNRGVAGVHVGHNLRNLQEGMETLVRIREEEIWANATPEEREVILAEKNARLAQRKQAERAALKQAEQTNHANYLDRYPQFKENILYQSERWSTLEEGLGKNTISDIREHVQNVQSQNIALEPLTENVTDGICDPNIPGSRRFGVELEFVLNSSQPGGKREKLDAIGRDLFAAGLTTTSTMGGYHTAQRSGWQGWSLERDATVDGELVSPILGDTPEDWAQMATALEILKRHGATTSRKVGAHVNISTGSLGGRATTHAELVREVAGNADILYRSAADPKTGTHRGNDYCSPNVASYDEVYPVSNMDRAREFRSAGYVAVSLSESMSPDPSARAEFRVWDGSLDLATIQMQVATSAAMVDRVEHDVRVSNESYPKPKNGAQGEALGRGLRDCDLDDQTAAEVGAFVGKYFRRNSDRERFLTLFGKNKWASA